MEYRFRIGAAFPAPDPVARYVVVLAMISNDWRRTMDAMSATVPGGPGMGVRLLRFRQAVAYSHEATAFLGGARKLHPQIDDFVNGLGPAALDHYDKMLAALKPVKKWIREQRNTAFHYPSLVPRGRQQLSEFDGRFAAAVDAAADDTSSVTITDTYDGVRFDFADAIVVHRLGFKLPEQEDEFKSLVEALSDAHFALNVFAVAAVATYLSALPPGTVESA